MTRNRQFLYVVAALLGFSALGSGVMRIPAEPAWAQGSVRWEYAESGYTHIAGGTATYTWEDPTRTFSASTVGALAKRLGVTANRGDSTSFLNAMGAQGWELVSDSHAIGVSSTLAATNVLDVRYWTLKRRR